MRPGDFQLASFSLTAFALLPPDREPLRMSTRPSRRLFDALGADRPASAVRRLVGWAVAAALLAAVFASYLNPHLALDIANRVWACF